MTLVSLAQGAKLGFDTLQKLKQTGSKQSIQIYQYDFVQLAMQLVIYFTVAWMIEIILRAKIFFSQNSTGQIGITLPLAIQNLLDNISLGGTLFNIVLPQFQQQREDVFSKNKILRDLFGDGISLGESSNIKLKYWDIIKSGSILLVGWEWYNLKKNNENLGGKISPMTHGLFLLIMFLLSVYTFPQMMQMIKTTDFLRSNLR